MDVACRGVGGVGAYLIGVVCAVWGVIVKGRFDGHLRQRRGFGLLLPLLKPPWTGLWKLGKSAMDGAFSPFATWMSRWGDPAGAGQSTACPQGGFIGVHFFGDFLCARKESYSSVTNIACAARNLETDETMPPSWNGWWAFSPVLT